MRTTQDPQGIVFSKRDVKAWFARPPTVSEARPSTCTGCGAASCPVGGPVVLHGHGLRERQVRGPAGVGQMPELIVVAARRYQCQQCRAVMTVVPRDVMPGLQYARTAIALSIALYGLVGESAATIRRRVSPWTPGPDASGWPSLRRWIARAASLWPSLRALPDGLSTRSRAQHVASILSGHGPPGTTHLEAVFQGAVRAR